MLEFINGKSSYIAVAEGILSKEICDEVISECKFFYKHIFEPGPTLGGVNPLVKASMDFSYTTDLLQTHNIDSQILTKYHSVINDALMGSLAMYIDAYRELHHVPNIYNTGFRLQHYRKNTGFYRRHVDGDQWTISSEGARVLGAIIYLNDVERGGETEFPEHGIKVPAKAGSISFFPANWTHPHMGCTPVSNDKWIISSFICVPNPEPKVKVFEQKEDLVIPPTVIG
jgi:hypothetical protein